MKDETKPKEIRGKWGPFQRPGRQESWYVPLGKGGLRVGDENEPGKSKGRRKEVRT